MRVRAAIVLLIVLAAACGGQMEQPSADASDGSGDAVEESAEDEADLSLELEIEMPTCQEGQPCDDGDACTANDVCTAGICVGESYDCSDDLECTVDACDGAGGCTVTLQAGWCRIADECHESGAVDPLNSCRSCLPDLAAEGWSDSDTNACSDNNACTKGDYCLDGKCLTGPAQENCGDQNPCTADSCDPAKGCVHAPVEGSCNDLDGCTLEDHCEGGVCVGIPMECGDDNQCTVDGCKSGACYNTPLSAPCEDGSACTVSDWCQEGTCQPGEAVDCDDLNPCTDDSCDPAVGCLNEPNDLPCDDGSQCTVGDACAQGACAPGPPPDCDDDNPCTGDSCDPATGCQNFPIAGPCDDGNPCTEGDACQAGECQSGVVTCTCQADADCQAQEDGNLCNGTLYCDQSKAPYSCQIDPATFVTCDPGAATECAVPTCQPGTGQCVPVPVNEGGACDDGDTCTVADQCASGLCVGTGCEALGLYCLNGQCVECVPACGGKECGPDGCGGQCGGCVGTDVCGDGLCRADPDGDGLPGETVLAPFSASQGGTSKGTYSGTVKLTVSGVGQSYGSCFNDAFYRYTCGTISYQDGYYHLLINGSHPKSQVGVLPYNPDHAYIFNWTISGNPVPLNFKVKDGQYADNTGQFEVLIEEP